MKEKRGESGPKAVGSGQGLDEGPTRVWRPWGLSELPTQRCGVSWTNVQRHLPALLLGDPGRFLTSACFPSYRATITAHCGRVRGDWRVQPFTQGGLPGDGVQDMAVFSLSLFSVTLLQLLRPRQTSSLPTGSIAVDGFSVPCHPVVPSGTSFARPAGTGWGWRWVKLTLYSRAAGVTVLGDRQTARHPGPGPVGWGTMRIGAG